MHLNDPLSSDNCIAKSAWLITDGKAGDEQQCIGVARALKLHYANLHYSCLHVKPRRPYVWLMPCGPIDPRDNPMRKGSIIAPPFPDIAIASGRRAIPYLRKIKSASGGKCFTICLKDPRTGAGTADFIWVPEHDSLRGDNVMSTLTSPHNLSLTPEQNQDFLPDQRLAHLPQPRIAVLLGGNSKAYHFTAADCHQLGKNLAIIAQSGASLMVTASRRTPLLLSQAIQKTIQDTGGFFWDATGQNPLIAMLTIADHIIVTADSVNMVGEAVSTGKPVHIFSPSGGSQKNDHFLGGLIRLGAIKPLTQSLESWSYKSINSTPLIAAEIERRYTAFKANQAKAID